MRISMIGGGIATISILNRECVCLCHAWSGIATISTLKLVCVCVFAHVNAWWGGMGGPSWL